jgi:hypothetical protein
VRGDGFGGVQVAQGGRSGWHRPRSAVGEGRSEAGGLFMVVCALGGVGVWS